MGLIATAPLADAPPPGGAIRMSEVIGALSYALDLTEGQPPGHSLRCTWIGVGIGRRLGLDAPTLSDLFYTILLKDCGCSSNAARLWELYGGDERAIKHDYKTVDSQSLRQLGQFVLSHAGPGEALRTRIARVLHMARHGNELATELIRTRCDRGARIVSRLGFGAAVAAGVYSLDEHWNGKGRSVGLCGSAIPIGARIALLAQVIDVFHAVGGIAASCREARARSGTWFDPDAVAAFLELAPDEAFWAPLAASDLQREVMALEPASRIMTVDEDRLDGIAQAFADVVDAKSSFTSHHSQRVTAYAERIAQQLGFDATDRRWLRRAALLHDIGKLGVSNNILDKPGRLDAAEWEAIRRHAELSESILARAGVFSDLAPVAGAHHERIDGAGYPRGLLGPNIPLGARIIAVADIFDALTAERPYRGPMPVADAVALMARDRGTGIDPDCFDALCRRVDDEAEGSGPPACA